MCILSSPPKLAALPPAPKESDEAIKQREALERARLAAQSGTGTTVKTDLSPGQVVGQKRVLMGV